MHFPDLEVCCDWSTFFPLKSADVSGAGTCDKPLRTSAGEARMTGMTWMTRMTGITSMTGMTNIIRMTGISGMTSIQCS